MHEVCRCSNDMANAFASLAIEEQPNLLKAVSISLKIPGAEEILMIVVFPATVPLSPQLVACTVVFREVFTVRAACGLPKTTSGTEFSPSRSCDQVDTLSVAWLNVVTSWCDNMTTQTRQGLGSIVQLRAPSATPTSSYRSLSVTFFRESC